MSLDMMDERLSIDKECPTRVLVRSSSDAAAVDCTFCITVRSIHATSVFYSSSAVYNKTLQ